MHMLWFHIWNRKGLYLRFYIRCVWALCLQFHICINICMPVIGVYMLMMQFNIWNRYGFYLWFFYSECVWVVSAQLCFFIYLLRLGSHLLKITFGAALPSKSIWILCTSAFDLSCMCYYKLRNAIWGFGLIWKTFLPFSHIMVLWYNSFLFLFLI